MGIAGSRRGTVIVVCLLAACAQPPATPTPSAEAVTPASQGGGSAAETRELPVGGFLDLALPANASTGYGWELVETGAPILRQAQPPPMADTPASPPMPGAGGTSRWRFVAERAGSAEILLVYRRSWEKDVPPAREARYRVTVTPAAAAGKQD